MGAFVLFIIAAAAICIAYIWGEDNGYKRGKNESEKEIEESKSYDVLR